MAEIISGNQLSKELRAAIGEKITALREAGRRIPCLAVIIAGNDPASLSYIRGKEKACAAVGMDSRMFALPEDVSQQQLEEVIEACNRDPEIDGILVQLPLPACLDERSALHRIDPEKDVDGLHPVNVGRLYLGEEGFVPCTPRGIMELLKRMNCDPEGKRAVVIGRSKLVGAPVARLLQNANATVTVCHSRTRDLKAVCREADILIAAIGRARMINAEYVREGAFVVDVGVNRTADGHLTGDVDFEDVLPHVQAITPVPGGVGPMTITMLLDNTLRAYEKRTV